jgi:hypothetical protein
VTWIDWVLIAALGMLWSWALVLVIRQGREDRGAEDSGGDRPGPSTVGPQRRTGGVVR